MFSQGSQMIVAGLGFHPGVGNPYQGAFKVFILESDRPKHRPVGGALRTRGKVLTIPLELFGSRFSHGNLQGKRRKHDNPDLETSGEMQESLLFFDAEEMNTFLFHLLGFSPIFFISLSI
jgi:hypothetical protein